MIDALCSCLAEHGVEHRRDLDLARFSYLRFGGRAGVAVAPDTVGQLRLTLARMTELRLPFKTVGATTNIFFRSATNVPVLLRMDKLNFVRAEGDRLVIGAGAKIARLIQRTVDLGYGDFNGLSGIPGTIGGAVAMNAGAFGREIADRLERVVTVDGRGRIRNYRPKELAFGYRTSRFRTQSPESMGVIVAAHFRLKDQASREACAAERKAIAAKRITYLDTLPNLGSTFATRNLYFDLASRHLPLKLLLKAAVLLTSGPLAKYRRRAMIRVTERYLGLNYPLKPYSEKNMNVVVHRPGVDDALLLDYIERVRAASGNSIPLEIEIL